MSLVFAIAFTRGVVEHRKSMNQKTKSRDKEYRKKYVVGSFVS